MLESKGLPHTLSLSTVVDLVFDRLANNTDNALSSVACKQREQVAYVSLVQFVSLPIPSLVCLFTKCHYIMCNALHIAHIQQ